MYYLRQSEAPQDSGVPAEMNSALHHLKSARMQLQMVETEVKLGSRDKALDRINKTISFLTAMRYHVLNGDMNANQEATGDGSNEQG